MNRLERIIGVGDDVDPAGELSKTPLANVYTDATRSDGWLSNLGDIANQVVTSFVPVVTDWIDTAFGTDSPPVQTSTSVPAIRQNRPVAVTAPAASNNQGLLLIGGAALLFLLLNKK